MENVPKAFSLSAASKRRERKGRDPDGEMEAVTGKRKHSEDESGWKRERPDVLLDLGDVPCCMGIDEAGR